MFHKRLLNEFADNRKYIAGMVLSQWISLIANVVLMMVLALFLGEVLTGQNGADGIGTTGLFIAIAIAIVIRSFATTAGSRMSYQASTQVKRRLREMIYEKLMQLGASYRDTAATSEVVQISTEGVDQLEIYFGKYVPQFFYSMLAPITLFVIVGTMSLKVALVLLLCVPLIPISIVAVQKFAKKLLAKYWGTYTELGDSFLENLQGLTTLKIYQADERYAKKMDEEAEKFRKVTMRVLIMQLNSISVMDLVAYGGAAVGIILSILELQAGNITLPECFFIVMISAEFFLPLRLLGSFFHIAMNGNAAADKIFRLLDAPVPKQGEVTEIEKSDIQLNHVNFGYTEEKQILKDVSITIPEKSFVALVGTSGCGKSTIASLIMGEHRLGDAKTQENSVGMQKRAGSICIGGVSVAEIAPDALHKKVTRVRHDSYLFAGTVLDNLRMGNEDATANEMAEALRKVDLYDTVMDKGGLLMSIEEKASNLSGGQRQRLVLARALLHDSDIYIFDEATSNVDVESENKIMEVVHELAHQKTVILISHRLANVVAADRIYVLRAADELATESTVSNVNEATEDSSVVSNAAGSNMIESGTHDELMAQGAYYYKLYHAQQELERYVQPGEEEQERYVQPEEQEVTA